MCNTNEKNQIIKTIFASQNYRKNGVSDKKVPIMPFIRNRNRKIHKRRTHLENQEKHIYILTESTFRYCQRSKKLIETIYPIYY